MLHTKFQPKIIAIQEELIGMNLAENDEESDGSQDGSENHVSNVALIIFMFSCSVSSVQKMHSIATPTIIVIETICYNNTVRVINFEIAGKKETKM